MEKILVLTISQLISLLLALFCHSGKHSKPLLCYKGFGLLYCIFLFLPLTLFANTSSSMYDDGSIVLSNDIAKLVFSENAELISCIDLKSNVDISAHNHKKIAYII